MQKGVSGPLEVRREQSESILFRISLPLSIGDMDYMLQTRSLFMLLCLFTQRGELLQIVMKGCAIKMSLSAIYR